MKANQNLPECNEPIINNYSYHEIQLDLAQWENKYMYSRLLDDTHQTSGQIPQNHIHHSNTCNMTLSLVFSLLHM